MQQPDAPSLAILDWMMPELDGIDVCRRIRELATDLLAASQTRTNPVKIAFAAIMASQPAPADA
jgi:CheY-like chemotaxis protein